MNLSTFTRMAMGPARDDAVAAAYRQLWRSADRDAALDVLHFHRHMLGWQLFIEDSVPVREKAKRPA